MKAARLLLLLLLAATAQVAQAQLPDSILAGFRPRFIGPSVMGGRISDLAVVEKNPSVMFVGTASGGLLKTVNGGASWEFLFDRESAVSIGDVTVDPVDANVVWIGTGESNNRQSSSWGDGVYKSSDGGRTWKNLGLGQSQNIARIVIDPASPDTVYVAAVGRLWGPHRERGVFKTTDGGQTWTHSLVIDDDTGVTDLVMDPGNPRVLIAAAYQRRRAGWGFNGGGPGSGIFKTTDGGRTWRKITQGLPKTDLGRIGLDIFRRNPDILYAMVENTDGGVYRSDDKGESWRKINSLNPRPMYFSQVRIDPVDDKQIWVAGVELNYSSDGGRTFNTNAAPGVHSDHHGLWVDPNNGDHVISGNDGGVWITRDRGKTWDHVNNVPIGQFYNVTVDMQRPYRIYGGMQDNYTWGGPSATRHQIGIINDDWTQVNGGDGMYVQVDPTDHNIVYTNSQNGRIIRYDLRTGERKSVMPQSRPGEDELRWNWTTPILISPHDPKIIYTAANKVFRSSDRGHSWAAISGDVTARIDREELTLMGVAGKDIRVAKNDGMQSFGNVTTLSESPKRAGLLYVGTDDGQVQMSRDSGQNWTNLTARIDGVPRTYYVSRVAASAHEEGLVYASFDGHRSDDMKPYVFASPDYGQTWRSISSNLPGGSVYVIREDARNPSLLYVGTEFGLFVSTNRGAQWTRWKDLPTVAVYDLVVHPRDNDLILGTHGRSIVVIDDVSPLQQMTEQVLSGAAHLFDMRPAVQYLPYNSRGFLGGRTFRAPNPQYGAYVNYVLKADVAGDVKVTVLDATGRIVRELAGRNTAGLHRVVWDLRSAPSLPLPGENTGGGQGSPGPLVSPGEYRIRVTAGGQDLTKSIRVEGDPLVQISEADRRRLFDTLTLLTSMQSAATSATGILNRVNDRMRQINDLVRATPSAPAGVKSAVDAAMKQVEAARRYLIGQGGGFGGGGGAGVRNRINQLKNEIGNSQSAPTLNQMERVDQFLKDLNTVTAQVNSIADTTMPALHKQLGDANVQPSFGPPVRAVSRGSN